ACAAADRARNAAIYVAACPDSALADLQQVEALRLQMLDAVDNAVTDGDLAADAAQRLRRLATVLGPPPLVENAAAAAEQRAITRHHHKAALALRRACRLLSARDDR